MAEGVAVEMTGDWVQRIAALLVVVLCATAGGIIIQMLMHGIEFRSGKVGPISIKPVLNAIKIPPLVGMIIAGTLARNFLCTGYMEHYPEPVASEIRNVCLSIILLRGGMELDFKGKGLTVVLLTLIPQNAEAIGSAVASRYIFNMPWALCFAQGFTLGAVSPAVLVPSLMILQKAGYGTKKGIPTTLIAASSFDDIIAITVFSVFLTIAFNTAKGGADGPLATDVVVDGAEPAEEPDSIWVQVGKNVAQIVGGFIVGMVLGFSMRVFNKCSCSKKALIWIKFVLTLSIAIATPLLCKLLEVPEAKYVLIIFYGYQCFQQWGEDKPEHELGIFWMFCQPFLFGTVGAAVKFDDIKGSVVGLALATILIGVSCRWLGTIVAAFESKYTCKERAFMAFAWIPKATVQAALGAMTLAEAVKQNNVEYVEYGQIMLTTAVFAICLTAPAGAIMINTLGNKWLSYDGEENGDKDKKVDTEVGGDQPNKIVPNLENTGEVAKERPLSRTSDIGEINKVEPENDVKGDKPQFN